MVITTSVLSQTQPQQDTKPFVAKLMLCVRKAAIRLEPSNVSPTDVASAALWVCGPQDLEALNALLRHPNPGFDLNISAKAVAADQAVAARLCRLTQDCAYNHIDESQ